MGSESPEALLNQLVTGYWKSAALAAALELGLPDVLSDGAVHSASAIAAQLQCHPRALYRLLRALASIGVFAEVGDEGFQQTTLSQQLTSTPDSARPLAAWRLYPLQVRSWHNLASAVRTGEPTFGGLPAMDGFQYFDSHPEHWPVFNSAMAASTVLTNRQLALHPFAGFDTIVDVGGGVGALLLTILRAHPAARGIVVEQAAVVKAAEDTWAADPEATALTSAGRLSAVVGNFFNALPVDGDAFVLKRILHDWGDPECISILSNVRAALASHPDPVQRAKRRVFIVELLVPATGEAAEREAQSTGWSAGAVWSDLNMLVQCRGGACERSVSEFATLFTRAGLELSAVFPAPVYEAVIEAKLPSESL